MNLSVLQRKTFAKIKEEVYIAKNCKDSYSYAQKVTGYKNVWGYVLEDCEREYKNLIKGIVEIRAGIRTLKALEKNGLIEILDNDIGFSMKRVQLIDQKKQEE